jgi:hypothetical protein
VPAKNLCSHVFLVGFVDYIIRINTSITIIPMTKVLEQDVHVQLLISFRNMAGTLGFKDLSFRPSTSDV